MGRVSGPLQSGLGGEKVRVRVLCQSQLAGRSLSHKVRARSERDEGGESEATPSMRVWGKDKRRIST